MSFGHILASVSKYYSEKLSTHGPTPPGVDWNSAESQLLRFRQLLNICTERAGFSINDFGCGYGALVDFMHSEGYAFAYTGFDISEAMVAAARVRHATRENCRFVIDESLLEPSDYTVASGVLNVKLEVADVVWRQYVLHVLERLNELSRKGFAFNCLTSYCDFEKMRSDLYYADPGLLFAYCKRRFSRRVALLHDYPLYEFTVLVRKEGASR